MGKGNNNKKEKDWESEKKWKSSYKYIKSWKLNQKIMKPLKLKLYEKTLT